MYTSVCKDYIVKFVISITSLLQLYMFKLNYKCQGNPSTMLMSEVDYSFHTKVCFEEFDIVYIKPKCIVDS